MPSSTFFNLPDDKRKKIIECAIDEFAQNDYDSASISQIVANAGIAKGSLYQYFEDKSDLHRYLIELASEKKAEMLDANRAIENGLTLFDTLRWLFQEMANFEILYPRLAKIAYRAIYGKSPLPEDIVNKARQSTTQYFFEMIEQGKHQGEIRLEIDSGAAAFIFSAALTQLGNYLATKTGIDPIKIAESGNYPLQMPEIVKTYSQIITILQFGMAK
jgi:TetR/AcrR family transcriptional regulator